MSRRRAVVAIAIAIMAVAVVAGVVTAYPRYRTLERTVVDKFSGRLWDVPARVYADSFVVYPGMRLTAADLLARLRRLGYRVFKCEGDHLYRGEELAPSDLTRWKHFDFFAIPE